MEILEGEAILTTKSSNSMSRKWKAYVTLKT